MDRLISCEFNMDTACVELKFLDGSMIAIEASGMVGALIYTFSDTFWFSAVLSS